MDAPIFAKLTSKGQMTLPKDVRDALGVGPGDQVRFRINDDGSVRIEKPKRAVDLIGIGWKPGQPTATLEEMKEAIGEYLAEDERRIDREWRES